MDQARSARIAAGHETSDSLVDQDKSSMAFVNAYSADATARIRSIAPLLRTIGVVSSVDDEDISMDGNVEDKESAKEKITILLGDDNETVIKALYSHLEQSASQFLEAIGSAEYIQSIVSQFDTSKPVPAVRSQHLRFISTLDPVALNDAESVNIFTSLILPSLLASANRPCLSQVEWTILEKGDFFKTHDLTSSAEFRKAVGQAKSTNTSLKQEGAALNPVLANAVAGES